MDCPIFLIGMASGFNLRLWRPKYIMTLENSSPIYFIQIPRYLKIDCYLVSCKHGVAVEATVNMILC